MRILQIAALGANGSIPEAAGYYIFNGYEVKAGNVQICTFRNKPVIRIKTVRNIKTGIEYDIAGEAGLSEFFTFRPPEFWYITMADAQKCTLL
ncbi:MAG: hypothetical protein LBM98_12745 [Oscillospiraceae bacterium]|jgi:hypothetical protein|nr:hypothetical protein [Oscillospiraceae bacterium]